MDDSFRWLMKEQLSTTSTLVRAIIRLTVPFTMRLNLPSSMKLDRSGRRTDFQLPGIGGNGHH